ncbi:3'-5' exonuclease [Serratia fonticola]|uniref:3'-5' exonuclease n=1 Tax=Serratia fonticola TaxID=47917 RepID=UPI0015C590CC|nr:3'-5' exonuclease [Serratia fonticola]NYA43239.1 3'-5' exonuclease [Serratia fonticola]
MTPQHQAQQWLNQDCLILDTETTGLGEDAEIVEITIIDTTGKPLINTLVKPSKTIPAEATAIHGITDAMVMDAPHWTDVYHKVGALMSGRTVVMYNASYDARLLDQTDLIWGVIPDLKNGLADFQCAMRAYAEFYGQCSERGGYKWQKLTAAAEQQGIKIQGTAHRALSDCLTTLGVIKAMAAGKGQCDTNPLTAQKAVDILARLFCTDPDAITSLVDHRVECSEEFATKTAAIVGVDDDAYVVGMVGIINALIAPEVIAASYNDGELTGFEVFNADSEGGEK